MAEAAARRATDNTAVKSPAEKVQWGIDLRNLFLSGGASGFCKMLFSVLLVGAWVYWLFWPIWWLAKGRFEVAAGLTAAKCTIVWQRCHVKCNKGNNCDSCDNKPGMFLSDNCMWLDKNKFIRDARGTIVRGQLEGDLRGRAVELQSRGDAGSNLTYTPGQDDQRRYGAAVCHRGFRIAVAFRVGSACAAEDATCLGVPPSRALLLSSSVLSPSSLSNRKSARAQAHKTHVTTRMYACVYVPSNLSFSLSLSVHTHTAEFYEPKVPNLKFEYWCLQGSLEFCKDPAFVQDTNTKGGKEVYNAQTCSTEQQLIDPACDPARLNQEGKD